MELLDILLNIHSNVKDTKKKSNGQEGILPECHLTSLPQRGQYAGMSGKDPYPGWVN